MKIRHAWGVSIIDFLIRRSAKLDKLKDNEITKSLKSVPHKQFLVANMITNLMLCHFCL